MATFDGVSVSATDVLVKYTYIGDANMDGAVTSADQSLLIVGLRDGLTGWYNGDPNYDGVVNSNDFSILLTVLRLQGAPLARGGERRDGLGLGGGAC